MKLLFPIRRVLFLSFLLFFGSCASYKQFQYITEEFEIPSKTFKTTFDETWTALRTIMKNYELEQIAMESGYIKTRWIDNTMELNFTDSFSKSDTVKSAKFKIIVNVVKGYRSSREVTKVSIFKRQMIEPDFLQGWKVLQSDGILEKTILYRLSRLLAIDKRLKELEVAKEKSQEKDF